MKKYKILIIVGSLGSKSLNKMLANNAANLAEINFDPEIYYLHDLPFFSKDLEENLPQIVVEYYEKIEKADGIILVSPEYNNSYSGVLKNALEWASRKPLLVGKPVSIMGATDGGFGTVRSQLLLKALVAVLNMRLLPKPEVTVSKAQDKFDEEGSLIDDKIKQDIINQLDAFKLWIEQLKK